MQKQGWIFHFQSFITEEEKSNTITCFLFGDVKPHKFYFLLLAKLLKIVLVFKKPGVGRRSGWMRTSAFMGDSQHFNRLCVYLKVLGQWRNEKLAFYWNTEKRPPTGRHSKSFFYLTVFLLEMATHSAAGGVASCGSHFAQSCFKSAESLTCTD